MIQDQRSSMWIFRLLLALTGAFVLVEAALNLTPPTARDALIHHLALPKLWLEQGAIVETPWADYSYYPMYLQLMYLGCLALGSDTAPKFVHMAFGLGTGILLLFYAKRHLGRPWGMLALVIFVTTPIVVWLSTSAYIDLGMTFFTTASLLAFFRWRRDHYRSNLWLLVSALSMGAAVGSKYNALVAWMIVNLMIVFFHARETEKQGRSLGYGALFFAAAALIASPWYIRNWTLTGNPFHPLFGWVFSAGENVDLVSAVGERMASEKESAGFFQLRRVLYGESFIETLLIPLRMFFQGQDDSYRYFQGVLNPILIVFLPFAFLQRRHLVEKIVLLVFSIFFIFVSFFTTQKQVRYLLPALPPLAVLAVFGIHHLFGWAGRLKKSVFQKALCAVIAGIVAVLLGFNAIYLKDRFFKSDPIPYLTGREDRRAYLLRSLPHYPAVEWINRNLPPDSRIYTVFLGRRGYYLQLPYVNDRGFGRPLLHALAVAGGDREQFCRISRNLGVSHLFMRTDLVLRYLKNNFSAQEVDEFLADFRYCWRPVYETGVHAVWELADDGPAAGRRIQE